MREESYDAMSRAGEKVVVTFQPDQGIEVRVGSKTYAPAWGSQASDDWLDWMSATQRGEATTLPVDQDDWLLDEGYHRQ